MASSSNPTTIETQSAPDAREVLLLLGGLQTKSASPSTELYGDDISDISSFLQLLRPLEGHCASVLPNHEIFVTGGKLLADDLPTAETQVYSPSSKCWRPTAPMEEARRCHASTLLPSGQVLVTGGRSHSEASSTTRSVEIYDPDTGSWSSVVSMLSARSGHVAVLLPSGDVLVAGGQDAFGTILASAEIYSPTAKSWTEVSPMKQARWTFAGCLLPNGNVIVMGGLNATGKNFHKSCEMYNITKKSWEPLPNLRNPRAHHTANLVNGKVVVVGGYYAGHALYSVEEYAPIPETQSYGQWTMGRFLSVPRYAHAVVVILQPCQPPSTFNFLEIIHRLALNDPSLTNLDLRNKRLHAGDAVQLAEMLKTNSVLTSLSLYGNTVKDEGAIHLSEALKINSSLTYLHLVSIGLTAVGVTRLAEALTINSTLTYLSTRWNNVSDEGAARYAEALQTNSTLTTLDLAGYGITSKGAACLTDALSGNSTLTCLDLTGNNIADKAFLKRIEAKLSQNKSSVTTADRDIGRFGD